eukprot:3808818-Rhodomonas_salina.2
MREEEESVARRAQRAEGQRERVREEREREKEKREREGGRGGGRPGRCSRPVGCECSTCCCRCLRCYYFRCLGSTNARQTLPQASKMPRGESKQGSRDV